MSLLHRHFEEQKADQGEILRQQATLFPAPGDEGEGLNAQARPPGKPEKRGKTRTPKE